MPAADIRPLNPGDTDAALAVINTAARWYREFLPVEEYHDPEMTREKFEAEGRRMTWYGAFVGGTLVGVMGLEYVRDVALLRHAYILPEQQRAGIGSLLEEYLERQVKGVSRIIVGTYRGNYKARAALEKMGYRLSADPEAVLRAYYSIPEDRLKGSVTYERAVASLWDPFTIATLTLRHRLIMAAMGTGFPTPDGAVTDRLVRFLARRAEGGIALVTTEAAAVDVSGAPFPGALRVESDERLAGLRRLAEAAHAHGAAISLQIYHAGRQMSRRVSGREPVAPSAIPCPLVREMPRALEQDEIQGLVEAFAAAAGRARTAGFDAVELHGAHGYLLHQFLTPLANRRIDDYGGDLRARARFVLEVVRRVRERVGRDFPILFKLSAEDRLPGGLEIDDTVTVGRWLQEAGVDALVVSAGTYGSFEWIVQPVTLPPACLRAYAARFRRAVTIPVVAVGRINDATLADEIVRSGDADAIQMGRALLADPDLPRKARGQRGGEIRPCITCNDCLAQLMKPQPIRCSVNPEMGHEAAFPLPPASKPKRLLVVGGGPAGMQAALVARARGHDVTLLEMETELGGRLRLAARPSLTQEAGALVSYLAGRLAGAGVTVRTAARATVEDVERLTPDAVIVATGARTELPEIPGVREPYVQTAEQCLANDHRGGGSAVVLGGGGGACAVAWFLRERGGEVTILAPGRDLARDLERVTRGSVLARLGSLGVRILHEVKVEEIRDRQVHFSDSAGRRATLAADLVVVAQGVQPDDAFRRALEAKGLAVYAVGDCAGPGDIAGAIHGATEVAARL